MTARNNSLPPGRNPPIFLAIGQQLDKPRIRSKGGPVGMAELLTIIWGACQGWSNKEIGYYANVGVRTVKKKLNGFYDDPVSVLKLPVIARLGPNSFQCRFCSETRARRTQAQRHFLSHMFADWLARDIDLSEVVTL